jgi:chemotaxis protein MotA
MMSQQPPSTKTNPLSSQDLPQGPLPPALQPPLLGQLLLEWVLPEALQEPVLGDLQEEFLEKRQQNATRARWWYRQQALRTCWHFLHQTKGDWLMFIFSLLFFIGISVWVMWLSSADSLMMFYDFPSLALIFPTALLFAIGTTSRTTAQHAVAFLFEPKAGLPPLYYQQIQHFFEVIGQSGLLLGWFTTLIGVVAIANSINAENFAEAFGPACGVCLLTLLYSYGLKTITYIAAQKVRFVAAAHSVKSDE